MSLSDKVALPLRTSIQLVVASAVVEFTDAVIVDMDDRAYQASVVLLTIVISVVQNAIEARKGKALLKTDPVV